MSGITGIDVTHAGLPPPGFRRVAILNPGCSREPAVLWMRKDGADEPIADVCVIHGTAAPPRGFQLIRMDVTRGSPAGPAYLAFRRRAEDSDEPAVKELQVLSASSPLRTLDDIVCPRMPAGAHGFVVLLRESRSGMSAVGLLAHALAFCWIRWRCSALTVVFARKCGSGWLCVRGPHPEPRWRARDPCCAQGPPGG